MITQTYTISTIKQSTPPIVKMSQYDHGSRTITFSVVDGSGQAVVLTGKTVRVEGTRLDGHAFAEDCTVSGSTASFTDTSDMTNAPGAHPAELVIESDGDRLGTMNFVISVETAAMDENADITEEDVSLFEQLLGSIEDATGAVEAEKTAALSAIDDDKDAALLAIAQGLASGSPLVVDAVADMTDQTAVYLYSGSESGYTAGNFYFWNGSAWVSGGTYGNPTVDAAFSDSSVNPVQNKVVSAAVSELKSDVNGGQANIPYVQTGTGYIYDVSIGQDVNYTPGGTGNNSIMAINDLAAVGLNAGDTIKIKVGWSTGFSYAAGFSTVPFASTQGVHNAVPFVSQDSVQEIEFIIPDDAVSMIVFNRANVYATPTISATKQGLENRVSSIEEILLPLQTEVENIAETVSEINIDEINAIISNGTETINLADLEYESLGYINNAGVFTSTTSSTHKIVKMDASKLSYIAFQSATALAASYAYGVLKDASNNIVEVFECDNTTNLSEWYLTPAEGNVLYVTFWSFATVPNPYYSSFLAKDYITIVEAYEDELRELIKDNVIYHTCVKKPFAFTGKTIDFYGDSITYGYIAASGGTPAHQADNPYPEVFCEAVGATGSNNGISGATLVPVTGYSSISAALQSATLTKDYLFIAGGVNDWQVGVDETTLESGVRDICTYLKANYDGDVIFITPINEAGRVPIATPTQTLQNVRNVITRVALENGYSVVQGWEFPFPTVYDNAAYISVMFQDRIHPTELGYSMYAQALRSAVC